MEIVPVVDLKRGLVVRARGGDRAGYQPIVTPLSPTSDLVDVVSGLLGLYPFNALYVADLDAIEGDGDNQTAIGRLRRRFPDLRLWVDNGIADAIAADAWLCQDLGSLVLGSETQRDEGLVRHLAHDRRVVLSLDFRGDVFQGPRALLAQPLYWPQRVIVMTLAQVGSHAGPDLAAITRVRDVAPDRSCFAAGGVRDAADLVALAQIGAAGALVASALHGGDITSADLARFA